LKVAAVDREATVIPGARFVRADLEDGSPWPFPGERFQGIVVTNYLHRPLFPVLKDALAEGGVLIYETFMAGNERFGKPSNPRFLLRPGELLETFKDLTVKAFEEGEVGTPKPSMIQRLCAVRAG
jgi:SAM-dependent methyltransferase